MRMILLLTAATVVQAADTIGVSTEITSCCSGRRYHKMPNTVISKFQRKRAEKNFTGRGGARRKRQVLQDPNSTWPGVVSYMFNTTDDHLHKVFRLSAKIWSDATCVDFVEDKHAPDKLVIVKEDGCFTSLGRLGGDQIFSLDANASVGSAVHEIGHVLGLLHTMNRYDRDSYIRLIIQNIDQNMAQEFVKVSKSYADVYGLTYDYGSIMHYGILSGSINQQPTMVAFNPYYQQTMGSDIISFSDTYMINERYGCNSKCSKTTSAKCANEGFPHPRNCSICICPSGYGGLLCDRRPPGCGEDLVASREKRTILEIMGHGHDLRDQFEFCNYMITAPEGTHIEVDVRMISSGYAESGCTRGGIEIKAQRDQKLTGYRYCSMEGAVNPVISSSNRLPVILFNRQGAMEIIFSYRYIG